MKFLGIVTAYIFASCVALLALVATQAMTGRENPVVVIAAYTVGWLLVYGVAGAVIRMAGAENPRVVARNGFVAFGAGGAIGGATVGVLLLSGHLGGSAFMAFAGLALPFTVPWMLGVLIAPLLTFF